MIDRYAQPVLRRILRPNARRLAALGVGADAITLAGFAIGMAGVAALALGQFGLALALILANRLADGLDGEVARLDGPTDRGAFLDIALDFVFYACVPVGFALADPQANALAASVLIAAFVGTGSSFLAFAAVAAKRGLREADRPAKGVFYLGGLTEGGETIAAFAAMCLWPALFPQFAFVFAALCAITTVTRWLAGWRAFAPTASAGDAGIDRGRSLR